MIELVIAREDPTAPDVAALLARHLAFATENTPPSAIHALPAARLADPAVLFFGGRLEGRLVVTGALRSLDAEHVEVKSMHTAAEVRGRGIGRAMLDHLLAEARRMGARRVSLETGTTPGFAAARALYARAGFEPGPPFGGYPPGPYTAFFTRTL